MTQHTAGTGSARPDAKMSVSRQQTSTQRRVQQDKANAKRRQRDKNGELEPPRSTGQGES